MSDELLYNEGSLHELLAGPNGAVVRDLAQRAIRVESAAKLNASHPRPSVPGSGPAVRTGRLRSSISWRISVDSQGVYADIGSAVSYARFVEEGTERAAARPYLRPALSAAR